MKVLIITTGCNPSGSAFSLRVHSLAQMASSFADTTIVSLYDPFDPKIADAKFFYFPVQDTPFTKIKRFINYYRTEYPRLPLEDKFDVIQIEHPNLYGFVKQFSGSSVILDEHNVWWELEEYNIRQGPTIKKMPFKEILVPWLLNRAKKYELQVLRKSDHVIVCSQHDGEIIEKESSKTAGKISYIPNCLDVSRYMTASGENNIVLFMGSLIYYPNIDAVRLICEEIAPHVQAQFHILGEGPLNLNAPSNVKFLGRVDDVRSHVKKARICIAPIRYGSGSRIKILEYMATGKPTISTSKGAEGLEISPGKDIIIEDDVKMYAARIDSLLKNETQAEEMGRQARNTMERKYDYRLYTDKLKQIYSQLSASKKD